MTRIAFWNVQRLGAGTDAARRQVLTTLNDPKDFDLTLFCELTTSCDFPKAQNLNNRKENARQLCYGALDSNGEDVDMEIEPLRATESYKQFAFKGGNTFSQLADRALAKVGNFGGAEIYVIHAPASSNAIKVMSFIATALEAENIGQQWIVVGDFNVEPDKLAKVNAGIGRLIRRSGDPTHYSAKSGETSEYDYALSNIDLTVTAADGSEWVGFSDHGPIRLEF